MLCRPSYIRGRRNTAVLLHLVVTHRLAGLIWEQEVAGGVLAPRESRAVFDMKPPDGAFNANPAAPISPSLGGDRNVDRPVGKGFLVERLV